MTAPFMAEVSQEHTETVGAGGCLQARSLSASWSGRECSTQWLHNSSPSRVGGLEVDTSDRNPSTSQSCSLSDTPTGMNTATTTLRRKLSRSWAPERESSPAKLVSQPLVSLKRKRPPLLKITNDICTHSVDENGTPQPVSAHSMNLCSPEGSWETLEETSMEGYTYAVASKRGKHERLEDTYSVVTGINGDPGNAYFGLFDGHGGRGAADYAAANLHTNILSEVESAGPRAQYESVLRRSFLTTDASLLSELPAESSGATAVVVLLKDGTLTLGNAGDCRAVLSERGFAQALSQDHRPDCESEKGRIEARGGAVVSWCGMSRVQGVLGVTRAFGDRDLKSYITAEPDVTAQRLGPESEFVVLATDGLWDFVGNQEAVDLVRDHVLAPASALGRSASGASHLSSHLSSHL
eukprot:CAMPEP_0118926682 /NCGR_PEP_ID=MMETSP1169-20130426/4312_1 /TAXON_ID=36882 /ORGANISM="Pyramimonas obovata, Strain CCMP722" /LENGTH=409 /DNA_ID=CAMNT_0006868279 /DNA_START=147 /DNA_END=1373 /DNA_ORIENTATION=-